MAEGRSARAQLKTARVILAMGRQQLEENAETGAHADRVGELQKLEATWSAKVRELEPLARREELRAQGQGSAFGI